jgi:hypothetical protein
MPFDYNDFYEPEPPPKQGFSLYLGLSFVVIWLSGFVAGAYLTSLMVSNSIWIIP